jgi:hypothetical protein
LRRFEARFNRVNSNDSREFSDEPSKYASGCWVSLMPVLHLQ